ncbi:MAG TPA: response regulator [Bryobacteraceae bacterium]
MKILLLEDNEADIFVIREVLSQCGITFQLHVARDGEEALSYLADLVRSGAPLPDLFLLDLNVPKTPGLDVLTQIRYRYGCSPSRIVVVTSSDSPADRRAVSALGAQAYFRKPSNLAEYLNLSRVVIEILRGRQDRGEQD